MKNRIVYTKDLWFNKDFKELRTISKLVAIYLISNENIGLNRCYKQPDSEICYLFSLSQNQLIEIKEEIQKKGLFIFKEEWVYLNNDFSYCDYFGRDKLMEAKQKEYNAIPVDIIKYFEGVRKGLGRGWQPPMNKETRIMNKKSGGSVRGEEKEKEILTHFNKVMKTGYTSTFPFSDNLKFWLTQYSLEDIKKAIENILKDEFWKDKMTPTLMFRRKNPAKERVDYIGDLLNKTEQQIKNDPGSYSPNIQTNEPDWFPDSLGKVRGKYAKE